MKETLSLVIKALKEEKELNKYKAQLAKMPINFEALEFLLKKSEITGAMFEIQHPDGTIIRIKPNTEEKYKTFKERFAERNIQ